MAAADHADRSCLALDHSRVSRAIDADGEPGDDDCARLDEAGSDARGERPPTLPSACVYRRPPRRAAPRSRAAIAPAVDRRRRRVEVAQPRWIVAIERRQRPQPALRDSLAGSWRDRALRQRPLPAWPPSGHRDLSIRRESPFHASSVPSLRRREDVDQRRNCGKRRDRELAQADPGTEASAIQACALVAPKSCAQIDRRHAAGSCGEHRARITQARARAEDVAPGHLATGHSDPRSSARRA